MTPQDAFEELARYYDAIMAHVDYARWARLTEYLGRLAPAPVHHLDAACGTGVLIERLRHTGWKCLGFDLSYAMLQQARKQGRREAAVHANLCAMPFRNSFGLITCLFDSINFLLDEQSVRRAIEELASAMTPGGLLYLDMVTERMVTEHFDGQTWTETTGAFETTWSNTFDRRSGIHDSMLRVSNGADGLIRERIYSTEAIEDALHSAGLVLLGHFDAHGWRPVRPRTTRIDFIAAKMPPRRMIQQFQRLVEKVRLDARPG